MGGPEEIDRSLSRYYQVFFVSQLCTSDYTVLMSRRIENNHLEKDFEGRGSGLVVVVSSGDSIED